MCESVGSDFVFTTCKMNGREMLDMLYVLYCTLEVVAGLCRDTNKLWCA